MTLLPLAAEVASWTLLAAAFLAALRLVIGPDIADRAVALDLLSVLVVAFAGLRAMVTGSEAYLDVAAVLALTGFLGTLAFARFILRRQPTRRDREQAEAAAAERPSSGTSGT